MSEGNRIIFINTDKWLLQEGGILDKTDKELLDEMKAKGKLIIASPEDAAELMQEDEPENSEQSKSNPPFIPLTMDDFSELGRMGKIKNSIFASHIEAKMTKQQALIVRDFRVNKHYTWRKVARTAFALVVSRQWRGWFLWDPPSNEIMGSTLCDRAATLLEESSREPPWN